MPVGCRSAGGYSILEDPKWLLGLMHARRAQEYEQSSNRIVFVFSVLSHCLCRQWNYQSETWQINSSLSFLHVPPSSPMPAACGLAATSDCSNTGCLPLLASSVSFWLLGGHCERMMEVRRGKGKGGGVPPTLDKENHFLSFLQKSQISRPEGNWTSWWRY